ncbi:hypothetical protein [Clostridium botulinum]|uniref:hypothetical protein n=1 Tax=Clostridium botulinum TaxID=1491 RepID=UPI00174ACAC0|nr:hypothetical protein [Clostridium botulinum]MBD5589308.1 hypothetical protein [Clostridium botulinum]
MKNKLKVGTRLKQVKPIEEYGFNYVGEEFMIIDIKDDVIIFECVFGKGGIDKEKIDEYFEIINDQTESIRINDKVEIVDGLFKNANLQGRVVEYDIENKKYNIQLEDGNIIIVNKDDVKLPQIIKKEIRELKEFNNVKYDCLIKIRGRRTSVKLLNFNNITGSVYCYKNDTYDEEEGICRAFLKAIIKQLTLEIDK